MHIETRLSELNRWVRQWEFRVINEAVSHSCRTAYSDTAWVRVYYTDAVWGSAYQRHAEVQDLCVS